MGELEPEGVSQEENDIDADSEGGDDGAEEQQLAQASIIPEETSEEDGEDDSNGNSSEQTEVGENASEPDTATDKAKRFVDLLHTTGIVATWTFLRKRRHIAMGLGFGLGLIALSIVFKCELLKEKDNPAIPPVHVYVTPVDRELTDIVNFRKFFILRPEKDKAYLSVDVSVRTPNESVYREIQKNRARVRSVVYDSLQRAIHAKEWSGDGTENVKTRILKTLNRMLHNGRVEEIVFNNWIGV